MKREKLFLSCFMIIIYGILLAGCGNEIARESIQSTGRYEFKFSHGRNPVSLWTDLDIEYHNSMKIWYQIQFFKKGEFVQEVTCNPLEHKYRLMSRKTEVQGRTKESFLAPMLCEVDLPEGDIIVVVDLFAEGGQVRIFRADLVIQAQE